MASTDGATLLDKIKRERGAAAVENLKPSDQIPNVADFLVQVGSFLQIHETSSQSDYTHLVFDNYQDWWMGPRSNNKLMVVEDNTVDVLHRYIAQCYDLGIPLTLQEKPTPEICLVQDIEVWGTKDKVIGIEEIIHPNSRFTWQLGRAMAQLYPTLASLDVWAYDATGVSRTKGVLKTSIRLVWPQVVVDKDRAVRICDCMRHQFKRAEDEELQQLQRRMAELSQDNEWSQVFSDNIYQVRQPGIRMPLCDRTSPKPLQKPEGRPFKPFCGLRFTLAAGEVTAVQDLSSDSSGFDSVDWVNVGSVRQEAGTPLTEWRQPVWHGQQHAPSSGSAPSSHAQARNAGRVATNSIRSAGGSDPFGRGSLRRDSARSSSEAASSSAQDTVRNVSREFRGTAQEFKGKVEAAMGSNGDITIDLENKEVRWTDGNGAQILFTEVNSKVTLTGTAYQVRSLLANIQSFATTPGGTAGSVTNASRQATTAEGRGVAASHNSYTPSAIYAPSAVPASHASVASDVAVQGLEQSLRRVLENFQTQGDGELSLSVGDLIVITHDPEANERNLHRWVFGRNDVTGSTGWFPLSHTAPMEIAEDGEGETESPDR